MPQRKRTKSIESEEDEQRIEQRASEKRISENLGFNSQPGKRQRRNPFASGAELDPEATQIP